MTTGSVTSANALAGMIVFTVPSKGGMANAIVSTVGEASPAAHSPGIDPEAAFVLAAVIASRKVHSPSSVAVSAVLLTVIGLAGAPRTGKRRRMGSATGGRRGKDEHRQRGIG